MTRNIELFDKIAAAIEANPALYCQRGWGQPTECGTAFCVAGWAAHLSGLKRGDVDFCDPAFIHPESGLLVDADEFASDALNLDGDESENLFSSNWRPPAGESVPDALRRIGRGGAI